MVARMVPRSIIDADSESESESDSFVSDDNQSADTDATSLHVRILHVETAQEQHRQQLRIMHGHLQALTRRFSSYESQAVHRRARRSQSVIDLLE